MILEITHLGELLITGTTCKSFADPHFSSDVAVKIVLARKLFATLHTRISLLIFVGGRMHLSIRLTERDFPTGFAIVLSNITMPILVLSQSVSGFQCGTAYTANKSHLQKKQMKNRHVMVLYEQDNFNV